ncbi:hypothetical protein BV372_31475 [Nostoc sp. T09]|uniref:hypothetical protein n=1 Tax=Nostoc sp. T09 TaxID=1932621 RepID=UPI000A3A9554|nr:hypothetical protein [Nostoc sp. T09]OUL21701.1 hypothetical protein BV372_31475 [Nostoc sp. T09]
MFCWLKPIAWSLTGLSLFTVNIEILSKPVAAGEPIIDKNCQFHERTQEIFKKIPPQSQGTVFLTSGFEVDNQKYILQVLKFPNSRGVFCLWRTNSRIPQRLTQAQLIQDKLIEKVEKDSSQKATYIVTIRGDKNQNILRTYYRLRLTNPNRPEVTPMVVVYKR